MSNRVDEYLNARRRVLGLLASMWDDPLVQCYNDKEMPPRQELARYGSVFLAGPTSRSQTLEYNWRCEAVFHLRQSGFKGYIYIPEPRGREDSVDFTERGYIHEWESSRLLRVHSPLFWIPRDTGELFGLNTNLEFGIILGQVLAGARSPEQVFVGWPERAVRMGLPSHYAKTLAGCKVHSSLVHLCYAVMGESPP